MSGTPITIGEGPKGRITIRKPAGEYSTQESHDEIRDMIESCAGNGFITLNIVRAMEWHPLTVNVKDIITVGDDA